MAINHSGALWLRLTEIDGNDLLVHTRAIEFVREEGEGPDVTTTIYTKGRAVVVKESIDEIARAL